MFLVIVVALAMSLEVSPAGRLTGTEILFVLALPFCLGKLGRAGSAERWFYIMAGLWLLGSVVTDLYRATPMNDLLRGWGTIVFFVINFTVMRVLAGSDLARLRQLLIWLYVALVLRLMLGTVDGVGPQPITGEAWKFGYGQLLAASAALLSARWIRRPATRVLGFGLPYLCAILSLALNARNLAGVTALSALASNVTTRRRRPIRKATIALLAIVLAAAGAGIIASYRYAAEQGYLGQQAYDKYRMQSEGALNLILSGRTEWLASPQAVIDSPIIGHGSWARDMKYVDLMESRLNSAGLATQASLESGDLIPTHSYLMQGWVESGILGAAFWFWAIAIAVRGLYGAVGNPSPYNTFYLFIGFSFLWDVFFSPFRAEARVIVAARLYLLILLAVKTDRTETAVLPDNDQSPAQPRRFPNLLR